MIWVFSTYVEVILRLGSKFFINVSVLHVCGGDPNLQHMLALGYWCSPRMWRWSRWRSCRSQQCSVFSTYVEVILLKIRNCFVNWSVLHVCGGDPFASICACIWSKCSPRMWRWSWIFVTPVSQDSVFSTYVEVILAKTCLGNKLKSVLHVCGGDPNWRH